VGRYLNIARRLSGRQATYPIGEGNLPDRGSEISEKSEISPEHRRLLGAGWLPKVRCGQTIWASPQSGFWYSQDIALELLQLDDKPP
jgi:hypothetical protein